MYNTYSRRGTLSKEPPTKDPALIDRTESVNKNLFRLLMYGREI